MTTKKLVRLKVSIVLASLFASIAPSPLLSSASAVAPACKGSKPAFTEVTERNFLLMNKNIHKYDNKRFTLRALIQNFYEEQGVVYFDAYWVGRGQGSVSFGTRGAKAYAISEEGMFDKLVEGDLIYAKVVIQPENKVNPTSLPIFLVCSVKTISG
jgi:hypothetical protein